MHNLRLKFFLHQLEGGLGPLGRPPPLATPMVITPLFSAVRGSVGVRTPNRRSDMVRSTGSVSFQQKYPPGSVLRCHYGSRKRGYDQGGCVRRFDLRLRRITSSPSQTLRRRLVRTTDDGRHRECSARRLPPFVAALFFTLRDSYG